MGALSRLLAALALAIAQPAAAIPCRLALAMGFDVSRSVDRAAHEIQIRGILAALFDPEIRALLTDPSGITALAVYEWSGRREQQLVVNWTPIRTEADIDRVARAIAIHGRSYNGLTAVGAALSYGRRLLARAPACDARILDIAGDGQNNDGPSPATIYARQDFGDITVNALAIGGHESNLLPWFEANVIRGPGAFAEYAPTHQHFAEALRRKLIRELTPPLFGALPGTQAASSPASAFSISATVSPTP